MKNHRKKKKHHHQQDSSEHNHSPSNEVKCEANMLYSVRIEPHPDQKKRDASDEEYRSKQLDSAKRLNLVSGIGTGIALLALVAVVWYACITNRQLGVMLDSNKISRAANIVGQRAFVFIPTDFQVIGGQDSKTKEKVWMFTFRMENSGNTPARIEGNYVNSNGGPKATWEPLPSGFAFPDNLPGGPFPNTNPKGGKIVIAPHQGWSLTGLSVPDSVFRLLNDGKAHVYFWGWVDYSDVFGCPHKTEFAREITSAQQKTSNEPRTFFIDNYPEHNCADRDCKDYQPPQNPECPN